MSAAPATAPAFVHARVTHRRTRPFTYAFDAATPMWLVDVDDPDAAFPRWLRRLASIRSEDHFAADDLRPLPEKIRGYLDAQDITWSAHRVLMLANARSLGYVFDPLSTYFCFDAAGRLEGVLAEVHNTYGERHCYPLDVAAQSPAQVDKDFYVSPFFAVEGRYDIRTRLTGSKVAVGISLTQDTPAGEETVFTASVTGDLRPATPGRVLRAVARNPLPSQRVSALIRWHGIRLWLRRLPVVPRRPHQAPKGMA
ncbi:MAG: DUF1365 domain-containing protein [Nocardioidaceae bacterium]